MPNPDRAADKGSPKPDTVPLPDAEDDGLTYRIPAPDEPGGPAHGSVTIDQRDGTITYRPSPKTRDSE